MPTTQRRRRLTLFAAVALAIAVAAPASAEPRVAARIAEPNATEPAVEPQALSSGQLTVQRVVSGFSSPLGVTHAGDGTGRLFVVQRNGLVKVVQSRRILAGSFIDARSLVVAGGERGLLGIAFHPQFVSNRFVYLFYTRASDGDIIVSRLTANTGRTSASLATEQILLRIEHSQYSNHNGGGMAFGPDGYLYLAVGDGGGSGDPLRNGQDTGTLLGTVLRIDVDGTGAGPNGAYAIPPDNPFVGTAGLDEIWAYGLRNPWRISFDRQTGNLFIADVGQSRREEVNREPASSSGGRNYGWRVMEGSLCHIPSSGCSTSGTVLPVAEYSHSLGCSITGGHVYRGPSQRDLQGLYVYGDFCSGRIWTMNENGTGETVRRDTSLSIASFGESETGELYLADLGGTLYRVIAPEFSDIASSTFIDDIHWLRYEGITAGCGATTGRFCPRDAVTRAQMAMFLVRAMDLPPTPTDFFRDDDGITGESSINALAEAGITVGCAPDQFCPGASVTRAQMALFLDRALDLPPTATDFFRDDDGVTGEAAIDRLAAASITGGCGPQTFCPRDPVTREQMAAFLRRSFGP